MRLRNKGFEVVEKEGDLSAFPLSAAHAESPLGPVPGHDAANCRGDDDQCSKGFYCQCKYFHSSHLKSPYVQCVVRLKDRTNSLLEPALPSRHPERKCVIAMFITAAVAQQSRWYWKSRVYPLRGESRRKNLATGFRTHVVNEPVLDYVHW